MLGFLFGAGAEDCYGLPLGSAYTRDTMLRKRTHLYSGLKKFYTNRCKDYVSNYRAEFIFSSDSNAFCEIIRRAVSSVKDEKADVAAVKAFIDLLDNEEA